MLQCAESIYRFAPSPYVQAFACSRIFGFVRTLAPVGPVVSGVGGDQRLHQCGVQRRLRTCAGVCRGRARSGANRFESAAIPFAGFVVHGAGAAGVRAVALVASCELAHAGRFAFVQLQPLCTPCVGLGRLARIGALGRSGLDIGLAGFGRGFGAGKLEIQSTVLS